MDMHMTSQASHSTSPERLDLQLYRRARVTVGGASYAAARLGGGGLQGRNRSAAELVLESADVALLALVAEGLTLARIGRRFGVNERTIRRRLNRLCQRLGVATPMQAVVWAVRRGVV
jgi:DNA-binding NarL/FixJ family response regulator